MKRFFLIVLAALGLFAATPSLEAQQVINSAGCDGASFLNALNQVSSDGATVILPSCPSGVTWTAPVNYTQVYSLTIKGQTTVTGDCGPNGVCTYVDGTVIIDNISTRPGGQNTCGGGDFGGLVITAAASPKTLRITGVTWRHAGNATCKGSIVISGRGRSTRIDHNHFDMSSYVGIAWLGWNYGVVDHNYFNGAGTANFLRFQEEAWNNEAFPQVGDESWHDATTFGSNRFVYVENNFFIIPEGSQSHGSSYADDCAEGGRWVWRFNQMQNVMLQTHPTGGAGRTRGCRAMEAYKNNFVATSPNTLTNMYTLFWLSAGTALFWGNTVGVSGSFDVPVGLRSMRRTNSSYPQGYPPGGWGYCGSSSGLNPPATPTSNWDQNGNTNSGRKCIDRPGMGVGDLLRGGFISDNSGSNNTTNQQTGCVGTQACAWPREKLEPVYAWSNSGGGFTNFITAYDGEMLSNEDYYNNNSSSCSGTQTTGVCSGLLADRAPNCSANPDPDGVGGVGYWATDQGSWNKSGSGGQGQLYVCGPSNTWSLYYTPGPYPHPLTQQAGWSYVQDATLLFCTSHQLSSGCTVNIGEITPTVAGSVRALYVFTCSAGVVCDGTNVGNGAVLTGVCEGLGCTGTNNGWTQCAACSISGPLVTSSVYYQIGGAAGITSDINMTLSAGAGGVFSANFAEFLPPPGTTPSFDVASTATRTSCNPCTGASLVPTATDLIFSAGGGIGRDTGNAWSSPYVTTALGDGYSLDTASGAAPTVRARPGTTPSPTFFAIAFKSSAGMFSPPSYAYSIASVAAVANTVDGGGITCSPSCVVPITSTGAHRLLLLAAANSSGRSISQITGGGTWTIPNGANSCQITFAVPSIPGSTMSCAYALDSAPGTTQLSVTMNGSGSVAFLVFEVASTTGGTFAFDGQCSYSYPTFAWYQDACAPAMTGSDDIVFSTYYDEGGSLGPNYYPIPHVGKPNSGNYFQFNLASIAALLSTANAPAPLVANNYKATWINCCPGTGAQTFGWGIAFKTTAGSQSNARTADCIENVVTIDNLVAAKPQARRACSP